MARRIPRSSSIRNESRLASDAWRSASACCPFPNRPGSSAKTRPRTSRPPTGSASAPRSSLRTASSTQPTRWSNATSPAILACIIPSSESRIGRSGCSRASRWKSSYPSCSRWAARYCWAARSATAGSAFGYAAAAAKPSSSRFCASAGGRGATPEQAAASRARIITQERGRGIGHPPTQSCMYTLRCRCIYNLGAPVKPHLAAPGSGAQHLSNEQQQQGRQREPIDDLVAPDHRQHLLLVEPPGGNDLPRIRHLSDPYGTLGQEQFESLIAASVRR